VRFERCFPASISLASCWVIFPVCCHAAAKCGESPRRNPGPPRVWRSTAPDDSLPPRAKAIRRLDSRFLPTRHHPTPASCPQCCCFSVWPCPTDSPRCRSRRTSTRARTRRGRPRHPPRKPESRALCGDPPDRGHRGPRHWSRAGIEQARSRPFPKSSFGGAPDPERGPRSGNVIRYLHPLLGNERALGLDYMKHAGQREAVMAAHGRPPAGRGRPGRPGPGRPRNHRADAHLRGRPRGPSRSQEVLGHLRNRHRLSEALACRGRGRRAATVQNRSSRVDGKGPSGGAFWAIRRCSPPGRWRSTCPSRPAAGSSPRCPLADGPDRIRGPRRASSWARSVSHAHYPAVQGPADERRPGTEVVERRRAELVLQQRNRALHLFTVCNSMVIHARDEDTLFEDICRMAVDAAGYRMAWIGQAQHDDARTVDL